MIEIKRLTPEVSVSRQPAREDFPRLKELGFRAVINNRLEGEAHGTEPDVEEEKALAEANGLAYVHLPVTGGTLTDPATIDAFALLLDTLPKPILAHCAGGTRSAVLWALANADNRPVPELLALAAAAGYDLSRFRDALAARAAAGAGDRTPRQVAVG